ncbi:unnamed protein product [Cuscuta epithymum]|uniref:Uncharacterized protein n=1 Tax=Cuscuta epithymum TaxID=186058 RepID=A0AAV0EW65_9ASTE|nr:unnamed protein product [Cuscuta epithymum]
MREKRIKVGPDFKRPAYPNHPGHLVHRPQPPGATMAGVGRKHKINRKVPTVPRFKSVGFSPTSRRAAVFRETGLTEHHDK